VSAAFLDTAREHLGRPGVEVEPRKMWPTGAAALGIPVSGKIAAREAAEPGRALGRLSDLGWGGRLRELLRAPDGEVPDDVFAGVVKVLAGWEWAVRPAGVVAVGSRTRPRLVGSLAQRLARVGRLPHLGELTRVGGGPPRAAADSNSVQRLAAVHDGFDLSAELAAACADLAGPVLLVDDWVATGWTMAVVARQLRGAGAPAVLPLALALEG
jgi:ATP-dependent DNA helicase RecQ